MYGVLRSLKAVLLNRVRVHEGRKAWEWQFETIAEHGLHRMESADKQPLFTVNFDQHSQSNQDIAFKKAYICSNV